MTGVGNNIGRVTLQVFKSVCKDK